MLLIVQRVTRHCFIFSIQRQKQEENRDYCKETKRYFAEADDKDRNSQQEDCYNLRGENLTLQLSVHKLCQWKDPTAAWILLENENLTSLRQLYAKNSQSLNVTSLCPALVSGFWFSSLLLSDSHTSFLHLVWKGSSITLLHHQLSATLTAECFPHTICTISDAMVFAKQGHRHRNTPTLTPSGSRFSVSPAYTYMSTDSQHIS